jgi:hypothetical protein
MADEETYSLRISLPKDAFIKRMIMVTSTNIITEAKKVYWALTNSKMTDASTLRPYSAETIVMDGLISRTTVEGAQRMRYAHPLELDLDIKSLNLKRRGKRTEMFLTIYNGLGTTFGFQFVLVYDTKE